MSLDFVIDVDASGRVTQVGSDYIEILLWPIAWLENGARRRIAVLDKAPSVLFAEPLAWVYLSVRLAKALIPEI
jgi:hypothetical protein